MQAIIFAFISLLGWGIGDIPGTVASRKLGAFSAILWGISISLLLLTVYVPFALPQLNALTPGLLVLNIILGLIFISSDLLFTKALIVGNPSLVGTICASFTAWVVIFSVLFLKETLTGVQVMVITVIFVGVFLSSMDFSQLRNRTLLKDPGVQLSLIVMLMWGTYFTFVKILVKQIGWFWPNYISFLFIPIVWGYMKIKHIKIYPPTHKGAFGPLLAGIILLRGAEFSFNVAIEKGLSAIVAPIAGASPVIFAPLAYLVFKEKMTRQQAIGIVITLAGIVWLSLISG